MSESAEHARYLIKLRLLWKGTLYITIATLYVAIIVGFFVLVDWRWSLLIVGFLTVSQLLRYVANEVDRIGWVLRESQEDPTGLAATKRFRAFLFVLLAVLVQVPNVGVFLSAYFVETSSVASYVLLALVFAEILFLEIRRMNRKVAFRQASYGAGEDALAASGLVPNVSDSLKDEELDDRLARLKELVDQGKISPKAYEKARDKYWVRRVMQSKD